MITNSVFMNEVSTKLNIPREVDENDEQWYKRVAYSLVGGHMLAALYDFDDDFQSAVHDDEKTVSMQHVLKRGENLSATLCMDDFDCAHLRELFTQTGYMLHKSNCFTYPPKTFAGDGDIAFLRGVAPWNKVFISGIGLYTINSGHSTISTEKMFRIEEQDINEWFSNFERRLNWQQTDNFPQDVEFLNINDNAKNWQAKPPKRGMTLYRTKGNGEKNYVICRFSDVIEKSPLSNWQTENGEYRRIVIALRIANDNAPTATMLLKMYTAEIVIDYLLPFAEQNFFELYSWPIIGNSRWRRTISIKLYPAFKRVFERMGYKVSEVK